MYSNRCQLRVLFILQRHPALPFSLRLTWMVPSSTTAVFSISAYQIVFILQSLSPLPAPPPFLRWFVCLFVCYRVLQINSWRELPSWLKMTLNSLLPLGASPFLDFRYVSPQSVLHGFGEFWRLTWCLLCR